MRDFPFNAPRFRSNQIQTTLFAHFHNGFSHVAEKTIVFFGAGNYSFSIGETPSSQRSIPPPYIPHHPTKLNDLTQIEFGESRLLPITMR